MQSRSIYPGQLVAVSVVAIDQSGLAIPTLIHTQVHSGHNLTVSEIISYETEGNCTNRNYSVTTKNDFNQLELYPNNRSGNTIHLIVNITFEGCPIGFERSNFTGECTCDHRLWQYTNSCDIDIQAILRNATRTFWIGVSSNNGTVEGYIHHSYCPLGYCTSKVSTSTCTILTINAITTVLGCCVGSAKKDLVLCWAAPSVRSVVTVTWLCLFHLH